MCKATGVFMFVYWSDGSFQLVLSYDGVGFHYNHLSWLTGNTRTLLLEHPAVWHWGPRRRLVRVPESQYSAVYSVPWSPLHSSVNSFTISFTLLLFTRSLQDRGHVHFCDMYGRCVRCWIHVTIPEYLLGEVVFLLCCDPWWREPWRLQRLLQPHTKQRETVLVQAEQHFCKLVHEAPWCPAPNALLAAGWSRQIRRRRLLIMTDEVTALWKWSPSKPWLE